MRVTQGQLASVLLGSVVISFVVNVLSGFWTGHKLIFSTLGALVVILVFLIPGDGFLRRGRYGRARGVRLLAVILIFAYPVTAWWTAGRSDLASVVLPAAFLWLASSLLLWTSSSVDFPIVALGTSCFLAAIAVLLAGVSALLDRPALLQRSALFGVSFLVIGIGFLMLGVSSLVGRSILSRVAVPLFGVSTLLAGMALLLDGANRSGVPVLLGGVVVLLFGVADLLDRSALSGVVLLLGGVVVLLIGLSSLLDGAVAGGVANLLFGAAFMLFGLSSLLHKLALGGVALLLAGVAILLAGAAPSWMRRAWTWLRHTPSHALSDADEPAQPVGPKATLDPRDRAVDNGAE